MRFYVSDSVLHESIALKDTDIPCSSKYWTVDFNEYPSAMYYN